MKKSIKLLLALLLALTMVFALVACEETTCTDGNHDWDDGEVVTPADCVTDGQLVRTCKNCDAKSDPEAIPATGHSYALAATPWTWSQDNAKATLHLVCSANAQHTLDIDVTATSQSDTADCTTPGDVTYTAAIIKAQVQAKLGAKDKLEIADESKLTATKTQSGTALGHDYQATFQWPQTYDGSATMPTVTAKLDCSRSDSTVTEGLTVTVTEKANSRQDATCGADGSVTLVATFQYDNADYTDEHPYTLAKTGLHNYEGQNYISDGATGHHRLCKVCQLPEENSSHTLTKYTHIAGQQAHSVGCTVCDYISVQSEPCTVVDNTCTRCNETYTPEVKDTVTVYFHATGAWTAAEIKAYAWYGTDEDTVYPLEVWPGTKMTVDGTDGWYKIEFQVPQGHVNTDLYVIVNDHTKTGTGEEGSPEYTGKQTGNALVNATTIYLAGIVRKTDGEEATAYTSKEAALAAEETPAPDPEKTQYVLVGQGQEKLFGAEGWGELEDNILARSGAEESRPNYYIKAVLKKGDQFKVKVLGDKVWKVSFGYTENTYYDIPETIKLTAADLFSCGSDEKGNNNDNIKALHDCTVYLTIYDNEPTKMKVYVESVDDLTKPQPDPELEMEDVTIYFHLPDGWTNAYLWGWYQVDGAENGTDLFEDLSDPKCKMDNDTENEGWVVITVQYPQGILREFKFASAPNWDDKKTENTSIEATGNVAWCSVKGNAFATKDAALNDEKIPAPTANDWFVTGSHMGNDSASTTNWKYAFGKMNGEDHYVVTLDFKNGEWFKIKKNDSTDTYWTQCISYNNTANWSITAAEGIEGTPANILGTNNDNNFVVQADCTLEFTFTPAVAGLPTVAIKITSGTIPADKITGAWWLVGKLQGVDGWTAGEGNSLPLKDRTYGGLEVLFEFHANDEFKLYFKNDAADTEAKMLGWTEFTAPSKEGDGAVSPDLFDGLFVQADSYDNIKVTKACQVYVQLLNNDETFTVYVVSVGEQSEPDPKPDPSTMEEVTIHFHLPDGWTNAYLWGWYRLEGAQKDTNLFEESSVDRKMNVDSSNTSWVVITVEYPQGVERKFLFTEALDWDHGQTTDTSINGNVAWCSQNGKAFATKSEAEKEDEKLVELGDYVIVGANKNSNKQSILIDWNTPAISSKVSDDSSDKVQHWYIKVHLVVGDVFKVRHKDGYNKGEFGYGNIWWDSNNKTKQNELFKQEGTSNIEVIKECTIYINIYSNSSNMTIYVESVGAATVANVLPVQVAVVPAGNKSGLLAA